MSTPRRPLAALAGVAFCLLGVAGTLAAPSDPGFVAPPAEIAAYYGANEGALLASSSLYLLAGSALLVFVGFLRAELGRAEGPGGSVAPIVFAGGVAGAALMMSGAAMDAVAALRVDERGGISPDSATVLWDVGGVLFGLAAPMALAVAVLGTALLARRTGVLPMWHVVVSAVLGLALLVPPINHVAVIVFTFWALITGTVLFIAGSPRAEPAGVRDAPAT